MSPHREQVTSLTPYAVETRYPGYLGKRKDSFYI
jgi:hypothetical protein